MKRLGRLALTSVVVVAMVLSAMPAGAAATCEGTLSYLALNSWGSVYVNVGFGIWAVCGVRTTYTAGGITIEPETCRAWYAAFLAAQRSGGSIRLYFNDPIASCAAVGNWVVPNPLPYHMDSVA